MKLHLHITNLCEEDKRINFYDPTHTYYIDGDSTDVISSTTIIYKYFGKFDADKIVQKIVDSEKWNNDSTYKYYQKTATDIKKEWEDSGKEASALGTKMHEKIEYFYNDNEIEVEEGEDEFEFFLNFYQDNQDLEIFRTEWCVFIKELKIAGSIDAVFINEDGTLSIKDWKRSKAINFKAFGDKCANYPLHHLPDTNYSQYSLQLNLYRRILEDYYGHKVKDMELVVCHPNNKNYLQIPVQRMDREIDLIFEDRKKYLQNQK